MEAKGIKVSIIIPVFNVAPYIGDCLRSVMRQTYQGAMECLIIDDCGTDDSIAIAEGVIREYNDNANVNLNANLNLEVNANLNLDDNEGGGIRFRILHHERNRGLSAARNTGTFEAEGEYLYYLDSDDEITDDCIEKLMQRVMEDPDIEMVQGNACRHLMNGESVDLVKEVVLPLAYNQGEVRNCYCRYGQIYVNVWNKLLKRSIIVDNNILCKEGLLFEDNLWIFYLLKYVKRAAFVADVTYHQKKRSQSITIRTDEKTKWYHMSLAYREIMRNLTPGYEREECDYYARVIASTHVRYVRMVPEYKEVLLLCREKCKLYGSRFSQLILAVSYILGKYKYGNAIWKGMMWVRRRVCR